MSCRFRRTMRRILTASVLAALAACTTPPRYERPAVELPAAWKDSAPRYAEDGRWWRIYGDRQLETLIDEALARNADLLTAAARVDEARALLADARGGASRQKLSERTANFFPGIPTQYSDYRATLNVSWEVDLFGRLRANVAAARADLQASEAAREGVRLALAAEVAKEYFALRSL